MNCMISNEHRREPFGNLAFWSTKIENIHSQMHTVYGECKHAICLSHRHSAARRHHHIPVCDTIEITSSQMAGLSLAKDANALARR